MNLIKRSMRKCLFITSKIFTLLPVDNKKILMFSYSGKQYSCNPKYISEYLNENYHNKFKIIWALDNPKDFNPIDDITVVKFAKIKYLYHLATAKVVVTNSRTNNFFRKRDNQYYIQTWHSSLRLKYIEKDTETTLVKAYVDLAIKDSKKCDLLISGCKYSTEIFKRAFWYNGEILECGTPRNDLLFNLSNNKKEVIRKKLNIDKNKKILLYAPTFRNSGDLSPYKLDFKEVKESFESRFGGEWIVLLRLHPNLLDENPNLDTFKDIIDVTHYDDIQELLSVSDSVISDYSSLIFDYALTEKPCFLYTPDLKTYLLAERKLYFNINKLPFPVSNNLSNLKNSIIDFNEESYVDEIRKFRQSIGNFEKGHASETIAKRIVSVCAS